MAETETQVRAYLRGEEVILRDGEQPAPYGMSKEDAVAIIEDGWEKTLRYPKTITNIHQALSDRQEILNLWKNGSLLESWDDEADLEAGIKVFPFQEVAAKNLLKGRNVSLLVHGMGMGATRTALAAATIGARLDGEPVTWIGPIMLSGYVKSLIDRLESDIQVIGLEKLNRKTTPPPRATHLVIDPGTPGRFRFTGGMLKALDACQDATHSIVVVTDNIIRRIGGLEDVMEVRV